MKKFAICILAVVMVVSMNGCGTKIKKKGYMTVNAIGENIENYDAGFKKYFDVGAIDASGLGGNVFTVQASRYVVVVSDNKKALQGNKPIESAFLIVIYDDEETVQVSIIYTSGAESENPTITNKAFISGISDVTKTLSFTPEEKSDDAVRAEQIAGVLYDALVEIEG